uniref:FH2 domain-containing protein n=1 Tax=Denticeps clupeoides TaxID=299321 RepID=A0AAY4DSE9_9TELE
MPGAIRKSRKQGATRINTQLIKTHPPYTHTHTHTLLKYGGAICMGGNNGIPPVPPPLPPSTPPTSTASSPVPKPTGSRTLRLHWRELQSLNPLPQVSRFGTQTIWAGLEPVQLDTNRLEYLFETKTSSKARVSVLGVKRSNIITIALSSLPPPHLLPPAVYSMDCSVLDREDVQKLQALVPSEEELRLIKEAKARTPHAPLAPAELCLLTLGGVQHLSSRLQLWAFTMDYDTLEREIAEPLFHLKLAMEQLAANQTFRCILATVLAIGNFLNGCKARGFDLSYLAKLSQVRDTRNRQPLLRHVCLLLLQLYPQCSDLHSDITAVTQASRYDYSQVQANLCQLECHCRASWEQLRLLERDGGGNERGVTGAEGSVRQNLPRFLKECEERLKILRAVHRRVMNRYSTSQSFRTEISHRTLNFSLPHSDFSLEYRATRNAILQQREREKGEDRPGSPASEARSETPVAQAGAMLYFTSGDGGLGKYNPIPLSGESRADHTGAGAEDAGTFV